MKSMTNLSDKTHLSTKPASSQMTHKEFWEFCQCNPDLVVELSARGELVFMAPADAFGDSRNVGLTATLFNWNHTLKEPGLVFGPSAGFTLPNGAIRSPDASWIPEHKWNALTEVQKETFSHICPDFVVELMSPSDRLLDTQRKMDEYIANGALLGFLIDRKTRQVHVYRPNQTPQILTNPATVSGDPELPGFVLPMARIF